MYIKCHTIVYSYTKCVYVLEQGLYQGNALVIYKGGDILDSATIFILETFRDGELRENQ